MSRLEAGMMYCKSLHFVVAVAAVTFGLTAGRGAAQPSLRDAAAALQSGDAAGAAEIVTEWLEHQSDSEGHAHWVRGKAREELGDFGGAVDDYRFVARVVPDDPGVFLALGSAGFKNADMEESISAFDSASKLDGRLEAQLWQRGIAHYYARRFEDGVRQFEAHRTVNPGDVENSVWHFLCIAASHGVEAARSSLIPVSHDSRSPMMEILSLFRGESSPSRVLHAAETATGNGRASPPMFYAHLYLGLYYEAIGKPALSADHIGQAVGLNLPHDYMWQVARIHKKLRAGTP